MNKIENIYLFLFIFSFLMIVRTVFRFISSLMQNPPQRLVLSNRELIFLGLSISYILTYLIS